MKTCTKEAEARLKAGYQERFNKPMDNENWKALLDMSENIDLENCTYNEWHTKTLTAFEEEFRRKMN